MLSLKPSAKSNRRYILVKGSRSNVEKAILEYIGVLGWAKASPAFVKEVADEVTVAVNREAITDVRAALALAKDKLAVLRVSGTIKGLSK